MTNEQLDKEQTTKQWQEEAALLRFQMIAPLPDESLDLAKRMELREQISEQYGLIPGKDTVMISGFNGSYTISTLAPIRLVLVS